jgi:hypothetical protein
MIRPPMPIGNRRSRISLARPRSAISPYNYLVTRYVPPLDPVKALREPRGRWPKQTLTRTADRPLLLHAKEGRRQWRVIGWALDADGVWSSVTH